MKTLFLHPYAPPPRDDSALRRRAVVVLAVSAVLLITLCSKCSPLYPFNDWVDANTYFTVGKGMLRGKVPYRDLIDQKGPLLFALHALAALVSFDSFLGVWLVEIGAFFAYLYLQYKTLRLFFDQWVLWLVPIIGAVTAASYPFGHGDSAEEFCLPLLAYALYVGTKAIVNDDLPTPREWFLIGLTSGCVLWIKYTMLGYYIGWVLVPCYLALRTGQLPRLAKGIGLVILGVAASALPFLVYFGVNGAIGDWFQVYFYDNLVIYPTMTQQSANPGAVASFLRAVSTKRISWWFTLMGLAFCLGTKKWALAWQHILSAAALVFGVYAGGWFIRYYRLIFDVTYLFGFAFLYQALSALWAFFQPKKRRRVPGWAWAVPTALSVVLSAFFAFQSCESRYLLDFDKSDLPQYQVKEVIDRSGIENPTLLNYGFLDGGFYTVCGMVPPWRYFCYLNVNLPEIMQEQNEAVATGAADFVVTRNRELNAPNYALKGKYSFWFEGYDWEYRLYQRK